MRKIIMINKITEGISPKKNNNAPKSQDMEQFHENRRAEMLDTRITKIWMLIKDDIVQDWSDLKKFEQFEHMPTDLLDQFDDDLLEFTEKCLDRYYGFLAKKKD